MPYSLSEEQIDYILNDIKQRGVEMEKLQINLLDHVCILLEERLKEGDDFKKVYEEAIKEFFDKNLNEIEKETKSLLKNKHYYKMKKVWYFILFVSLGYNVIMGSKAVYKYFKYKNEMREWLELKETTFKEGHTYLLQKLKEEYPEAKIKDYICISFLGQPMSDEEREIFGLDKDTASERQTLIGLKQEYKSIDSLSNIYKNNITYVFAFEKNHFPFRKNEEATDEFIISMKQEFKSALFLKDMNKLMAAYENNRKGKVKFYPTIFVVDRNSKLVFDCNYFAKQHVYLAKFLKTLPG